MAQKAIVDPVQRELTNSIDMIHGFAEIKTKKDIPKVSRARAVKNIKCLKRVPPVVKNYVLEHKDSKFIKLTHGEAIPDTQTVKDLSFVFVIRGTL